MKIYRFYFLFILMFCIFISIPKAYSAIVILSPSQDEKQLNKLSKDIKCGDTIVLKKGKYLGRLRLKDLICGKTTTISSDSNQFDTLALVGSIVVSNSTNIVIKDLIFQNGDASLGVYSSTAVILKNNTFRGTSFVNPLNIRQSKNVMLLNNQFEANAVEQINVGDSSNIIILKNHVSLGRHAALQFHPYGSVKNVLVSKNIFSAKEGRAVELFMTKNVVFYKNIIKDSGKSQYARDASSKFMTDTGFFIANTFRNNYGTPIAIFPYKKDSYIKNLYLVGNYFMRNEFADIDIGGNDEKLKNIYIINNVFDAELHKFTRIKFRIKIDKNILSRLYISDNVFKKREEREKLFKTNKKSTNLSAYNHMLNNNGDCKEERLSSSLAKLPASVNRSLAWLSEVDFEGKEESAVIDMTMLQSIKEEIVRETSHLSKTCMSMPIDQEVVEQNESDAELLNLNLSWRIKLNEDRLSLIKHEFVTDGTDRELKIFSNGKMSINLLGMQPMQQITFEMDRKCTSISQANVLYFLNSLNNLKYERNLDVHQEIVNKNGQSGYLCSIDARNEMDIKEVVVVFEPQCCSSLTIRSVLLH